MNTTLSVFLLLLLYYNGLLVYSKNGLLVYPKNDTQCGGIYHEGRIQNGKFAQLHSSNITQCAKLCFYRKQCKGFSFLYEKSECNLHKLWKNSFQQDDKYVSSLIETWNPRVAGSCFNHSCGIDEMCLPEKNAYYCLKLDIDCGVPPQMSSSVITWRDKSHVKYRCLVNLLGEGTRKSKCEDTSVWSKPNACHYSCKQPYLVSFKMANSTYSESSWRYECLGSNTSCRMKTIWHDEANNYLNISCTMKNNEVRSQLTNFSYLCAKARSTIALSFGHIHSYSKRKFQYTCNITCGLSSNKTTSNDHSKPNCTRRILCRWVRFPEVLAIQFCAFHKPMENGTISFEGVMKMVCEVFERFSLEAHKRKLAARLLDFKVGLWNNGFSQETVMTSTEMDIITSVTTDEANSFSENSESGVWNNTSTKKSEVTRVETVTTNELNSKDFTVGVNTFSKEIETTMQPLRTNEAGHLNHIDTTVSGRNRGEEKYEKD